jgi:HPt (histidine-containing phosphotransfer) domain-containing protein
VTKKWDIMVQKNIFLPDQLNQIAELDEALAQEIIHSFLESLPQNVKELRIFLSNKDFEKMNFSSHSLKNNAANVGGEELKHCCEELEKYSTLKDLNKCTEVLESLESGLETLVTEIRTYLQKLS